MSNPERQHPHALANASQKDNPIRGGRQCALELLCGEFSLQHPVAPKHTHPE
jgi:hypothetical protein